MGHRIARPEILILLLTCSVHARRLIHVAQQQFEAHSKPQYSLHELQAVPAERCQHVLLHFRADQQRDVQQQLHGLGIAFEYIPDNTLCVCAHEGTAEALLGLGALWTGVLSQEHRLHSATARDLQRTQVKHRQWVSLAAPDSTKKTTSKVKLVVHTLSDVGLLQQKIHPSTKFNGILKVQQTSSRTLVLTVDASHCSDIAEGLTAFSTVLYVQLRASFKPMNRMGTAFVQSGLPTSHPFWAANLTGKGQRVHIGDTGLDSDHCYFTDLSNPVKYYPEVSDTHRKIYCYIESEDDDGYSDHTDAAGAHGTHVSGSVAGSSITQAGKEWNGVAPDARIVFTDLSTDGQDLYLPPDFDIYFRPAWELGCKLSSNSWGSEQVTKDYTATDRETDIFMWNNQDMLVFVAAGNSGMQGILSPGSSKNTLSVGATLNNPGQASDLLSYSARGPTWDKRAKPEIVAPGSTITSARSDGRLSGTTCDTSGKSGTSMATPLVAGAAVLVREYFEERFYPTGVRGTGEYIDPTAALVKAIIIHSGMEVNSPPSRDKGFGRMNLQTVLPLEKGGSFLWVLNNGTLHHHGSFRQCFRTAVGAGVKVTLAWVDAVPGPNAARSTVNDLDLTVGANGNIVTGNHNSPIIVTYPGSTSKYDYNNVVEQAQTQAKDGTFWVHVFGHHVPLTHPAGQPFSLVVTAPNVVAVNCNDSQCSPSTCRHGKCVTGQCVCDTGFVHADCSLCDEDALCSGHGRCSETESTCRCDSTFEGLHCERCKQGWFGPNCDSDCRCNHGTCNVTTGACGCVRSDELGHWGGKKCDHCAVDYAGTSCTLHSHWCNNFHRVQIGDSDGIIQVTGEPQYREDMDCQWFITAPPGATITLTIVWAAIERNYDFLNVFDHDARSLKEHLKEFTGTYRDQTVASRTGVMYLRFTSDVTNVDKGFYATYQVRDAQGRPVSVTPPLTAPVLAPVEPPVKPVAPPVEPVKPVAPPVPPPVKPVAPPVKPVAPPVKPVAPPVPPPVKPVAPPVDPPVQPVKPPVQPVKPPVQPAAPVTVPTNTPARLAEPVQQPRVQPTSPRTSPVQPVQPVQPVRPVQPVQPVKPVQPPTRPAAPSSPPAVPATPPVRQPVATPVAAPARPAVPPLEPIKIVELPWKSPSVPVGEDADRLSRGMLFGLVFSGVCIVLTACIVVCCLLKRSRAQGYADLERPRTGSSRNGTGTMRTASRSGNISDSDVEDEQFFDGGRAGDIVTHAMSEPGGQPHTTS